MANFITKEVIEAIKKMLSEHLYEEQDAIDNLYGDESDSSNRKMTVNFRVNLSDHNSDGIEAKSTIDYIINPATPAQKTKKSKKAIIGSKQKELFKDK